MTPCPVCRGTGTVDAATTGVSGCVTVMGAGVLYVASSVLAFGVLSRLGGTFPEASGGGSILGILGTATLSRLYRFILGRTAR